MPSDASTTSTSPARASSTLRLRPNLPIVWVSPTTLQIGLQRPVVRIEATDTDADAIARMRAGLHSRHLRLACGAARARDLIAALEPALLRSAPGVRARVTGSLPLATALMRALRDTGLSAGRQSADVVVSVAAWCLPEPERQRAFARGVRQLPVVVGDDDIAVGPVWAPDRTPCWRCTGRTRPLAMPLVAEQDSVLQLDALEEAVVIGAVASLLGPIAAGEEPTSAMVCIRRGTCATSTAVISVDPACGCAGPGPGRR